VVVPDATLLAVVVDATGLVLDVDAEVAGVSAEVEG
jgi:hypothetical protein